MAKTQPKTRRAGVNDLSDEQKAELRARAEALAAEYSTRLPQGDAGLIEADRRLQEYRPRETALYREYNIGFEIERDIIIPTIRSAQNALVDHIEQTAPQTMVGAVVKLRRLCDEHIGMAAGENEGELSSLQQVFEFIERQAGSVPDDTVKVLHPDPLAAAVSEALALRLLSRYRDARDTVEHYGGDVSALPAAPPFAEIDKRYMELMHDVLGVPPDTASAELRYLDLIEAIIADQLLPHEGPVMSEGEDLSCALQMLKWVQRLANSRDIAEGIASERAKRKSEGSSAA
jgi:hypothetical protein